MGGPTRLALMAHQSGLMECGSKLLTQLWRRAVVQHLPHIKELVKDKTILIVEAHCCSTSFGTDTSTYSPAGAEQVGHIESYFCGWAAVPSWFGCGARQRQHPPWPALGIPGLCNGPLKRRQSMNQGCIHHSRLSRGHCGGIGCWEGTGQGAPAVGGLWLKRLGTIIPGVLIAAVQHNHSMLLAALKPDLSLSPLFLKIAIAVRFLPASSSRRRIQLYANSMRDARAGTDVHAHSKQGHTVGQANNRDGAQTGKGRWEAERAGRDRRGTIRWPGLLDGHDQPEEPQHQGERDFGARDGHGRVRSPPRLADQAGQSRQV